MVGIDSSIALAIWFPSIPCSVDRAKDRVEYLLEELAKRNERILIPTPALSEILVRAGSAGADFVNRLSKSARFEIAPFDALAAVEVALAIERAKKAGGKKASRSNASWAKTKFDHQIVAICRVRQVTVLYSDDPALCNFARHADIRTYSLADLPLPPYEPTLFDHLDDIPQIAGTGNKNTPKQLTSGNSQSGDSEKTDPDSEG